MAKIDLKQSCGLPITYTGEDLLPQGLTITEVSTICIDNIRSQLLNEDLNCPETFYKKYKDIDKDNVFKKKGIKINMYLIYANLAGIEYVKTFATRSRKYPRILEVSYGSGVVLLQRYESAQNHRIIKLTVKKGDKVIIPAGYTCSITNSRQNSNLIVLEIHSRKARPRIVLDDMKGMSYYIIRKNAKQETVRNPEYKFAKDPEKFNMDGVLSKYGIRKGSPIVKQIMRKYEKFTWIFKKDSVTI